MIYVTISISFLFIIFSNFKNIKKYLPFIILILSMLSWGVFGYVKTGKFPFLNSITSTNQLSLALVLNKDFGNHFPKSIDIIYDNLVPQDLKKFSYKNEWEVHNFFKKKNIEYLKKNKLETIKNIFLKINFILFNTNHNNFSFFLFFNKVIFIISIIMFFFKLYKKKINFVDIYFVAIITSNLLPHLIGWVTNKHMVPVFIICNIYVYTNALKSFKEIEYKPLNK